MTRNHLVSRSRCGNAITKRIALIEHEVSFPIHERRAGDARNHFTVLHRDGSFKQTADDALLSPLLTRLKFAVGVQTRDLRARSRPTGGTVISLSRTQNEVLAIGIGAVSRFKNLHVIDLRSVSAGNSIRSKSLSNSPGEVNQLFEVIHRKLEPIVLDEKKPVSAPG